MTGGGAANRTFGYNTQQAIDMRNAPGVNRARDLLCYKWDIGDGNPSVSNAGRGSFGIVTGPLFAWSNSTRQFVGSYRVDFVGNENGTATFSVTNTTHLRSFLYHLPFVRSYERSATHAPALRPYGLGDLNAPGGNMRQTYTWTETVSKSC